MKKYIFFSTIFLSVLLLETLTVSPSYPVEEDNMRNIPLSRDDIYLEEIVFEKRLEERLGRDIAAYLGHDRFIVKVNADIMKTREVVKEPVSFSLPYLAPPLLGQPSPSAAVTGPAPYPAPYSLSMEQELLELPGIPVPQQSPVLQQSPVPQPSPVPLPQPSPPVKQEPLYKDRVVGIDTEIKKITVSVLLDKETSAQDEEFIKNIIFQKANLDMIRGDTLEVIKMEFPNIEAAGTSFLNERYWYIMPAAILFLSIVIFLLIAVLLFRRKKDINREQVVKVEQMPSAPAPVESKALIQSTTEEEKKQVGIDKQKETWKQEIATLALGNPDLAKNVSQEVIREENGIQDIAILLKGLGARLASGIFPGINGNERIAMEKYLTENPDINEEEMIKKMEEFYYKLYYRGLIDVKANKSTPFSFLRTMDDRQITYLINDEEVRVQALVFSQLPPDRSATIISMFPPARQAQIASEIGCIESFPMQIFEDVANRLSKKSLTTPSFENITYDGMNLLANIFDYLDGATEKGLFENLKKQSPEIHHRFKKVYFSFTDIPALPDHALKNVLREIDIATIALSMLNVETEISEKIIGNLPERQKIMVKDEVSTLAAKTSQKEIEAARYIISTKIRKLIKGGQVALIDTASSDADDVMTPEAPPTSSSVSPATF